MFDDIFSDGSLIKYIKEKQNDIWKNTPFEGYVHLNPRQKGSFGEMFVEKYLTNRGHTVEKRVNAGHDRIIDDYKTEIKFGMCNKGIKDCFLINHISKNKDWDKGTRNKVYKETLKNLGFKDDEIFSGNAKGRGFYCLRKWLLQHRG